MKFESLPSSSPSRAVVTSAITIQLEFNAKAQRGGAAAEVGVQASACSGTPTGRGSKLKLELQPLENPRAAREYRQIAVQRSQDAKRTQRNPNSGGPAACAHQTVTPKSARKGFPDLCAFAPLPRYRYTRTNMLVATKKTSWQPAGCEASFSRRSLGKSVQCYPMTSFLSEKIFYHGWTRMNTDQRMWITDAPSESVSIRVHPWLNDFGCGFAALCLCVESLLQGYGSAITCRLVLATTMAVFALSRPAQGVAGKINAPTFTEHVAPIISQNCATCHRPGEIGPFPLLTYQDVRKRARQIAEVTATRFMPPWHAELGHVEFLHPRVLSAKQLDTLRRWQEAGAPEGDPKKLPKPPVFPAGWQLGKPDLILKMDRAFQLDAEGKDIYRNFVFPLNLPEDKWVRAIEFRPGARGIVHHALFFLDLSGAAREADAADAEPGYEDKGRAGRLFTPVGGWAVGSNVRALPDGLAYRYPTNADLVVQTHFHPTGKAEEELSTIGLYFAKGPPKLSFVGIQLPPAFGEISGIDIPAGATNYVVRDTLTLPVDVEAFAIAAHAHYLGKVMTMKATLPDGREKILLRIPDWDFAWQEQYTFKERVKLPKGTRLETEMTYDNSATNPRNPTSPPVRVKWGPRSTDEMGSVSLQVVPTREEDVAALREVVKDHAVDMVIDRALEQPKRGEMVKTMFRQFDKDGDGQLSPDERASVRDFIKHSERLPGGLNNSF